MLGQYLLKGLATAAPLMLTIWLIYWAVSSLESFSRPYLQSFLPDGSYIPGMGMIAALLLISGLGLLANLYLVRILLAQLDRLMSHIPLVKTLLQGIKDFAQLLAGDKARKLNRVVSLEFQGIRMIGFVVRESVNLPGLSEDDQNLTAVYMPMSYMVGGYTVYVPQSALTPLDIQLEEAMRMVLTGGAGDKQNITTSGKKHVIDD